MQKAYETRYLNAVKELAESGMEVHALSGRAVRQSLNSSVAHAMSEEFECEVRQLCSTSLAVSADSADQLAKNLAGHKRVGAPSVKAVNHT